MQHTNPLAVAFDTTDVEQAAQLCLQLKPYIGYAKIGMEFFYAQGLKGYEKIAASGLPIFLDLKLHDIPNTVASGLKSLLKLVPQPAILNVHASGGLAMMKAAKEAVGDECKLIAVTLLTSLSLEDAQSVGFNVQADTESLVLRMAEMAKSASLDGVVCSPLDLSAIRRELGTDFLTVVPGIRPESDSALDQKRIATPKVALEAGADILVIGRPITRAVDPAEAALRILAEIGHSPNG